MRGPPPSAVRGSGPARGRVGDNRSPSEIGMSNSSIRPARAPFPHLITAASVFEGWKDGEPCRDPEDPGVGHVSVSEGGRRFGRAMLRMRWTAPGSLLSQESRAAFARTCRSSWTRNGQGPAVGSNVGATGRCAVSGERLNTQLHICLREPGRKPAPSVGAIVGTDVLLPALRTHPDSPLGIRHKVRWQSCQSCKRLEALAGPNSEAVCFAMS